MIATTIEWHKSLSSTQSYVRGIIEQSSDFVPVAVATRTQIEGVGRHGRSWAMSPDSLAISINLRSEANPTWIPPTVAMSVLDTLGDCVPIPVGTLAGFAIKWPNDILMHGKKIAGIIVHAVATTAGQQYIIGLGINIGGSQSWFDSRNLPTATSLELAGISSVTADEIGSKWLKKLQCRLSILERGGAEFAEMQKQYAQMLADIGRMIAVDGKPIGQVAGVGEDGCLLVSPDAGTLNKLENLAHVPTTRVTAGIVEWL